MKKKSHKVITIGIILIMLLLVGGLGYFFYNTLTSKQLLGINGYYDKNGNKISQSFLKQSVIGNVDGVAYITLAINVVNEDKYDGTFTIIDASPLDFKNSIAINSSINVKAGQTATWTSGLIPVKQWESKTVNFSVTVRATSNVRATVDKTAQLSIDVKPDMPLTFSIGLNSSVNNDPGANQPPVSGSTTFQTNAVGGWDSYTTSTWIRVDLNKDGILEQYSFFGNGPCQNLQLGYPKITNTTEGYGVYCSGAACASGSYPFIQQTVCNGQSKVYF